GRWGEGAGSGRGIGGGGASASASPIPAASSACSPRRASSPRFSDRRDRGRPACAISPGNELVLHCDSNSKRGSAQNRKGGKDSGAFTSVEMLISRQRFASAARTASASPAYLTASLPNRRCAGKRSLVARRRTT